MKNTFYAFIIISLLFSCKSNTNQHSGGTVKTKSVSNQSEALIKKFMPIIQGAWVNQVYINKIIKTRSVLSAMDKAHDFITIYIDKSSIKGDSLVAPTGDTHDGSQITLHFQNGTSPMTIKAFEGGELGYTFEHRDTILFFTRFDNANKRSITTKFVKSVNSLPKGDLELGINYLINKAIISGNYTMTDTSGSSTKITFTNDGKVHGFLNHSEYRINFDLNSAPMDNLDEISFDIRSQNYSSFSYKIIGDTLSLYETHPSADSSELILGKRIHKLVKQK